MLLRLSRIDHAVSPKNVAAGLCAGDATTTGSFQNRLDLFPAPAWVGNSHIQNQLFGIPVCFGRLPVRTTALVTKLLSFPGSLQPLVTGFAADSIFPAQC